MMDLMGITSSLTFRISISPPVIPGLQRHLRQNSQPTSPVPPGALGKKVRPSGSGTFLLHDLRLIIRTSSDFGGNALPFGGTPAQTMTLGRSTYLGHIDGELPDNPRV